jgi:hypothetical protein
MNRWRYILLLKQWHLYPLWLLYLEDIEFQPKGERELAAMLLYEGRQFANGGERNYVLDRRFDIGTAHLPSDQKHRPWMLSCVDPER